MKTNKLQFLAPDRAHMLREGWAVIGTGGGCEAFSRQDGRTYWLLTDKDDPSLPDDMNQPCTLSLFDDADGSFLGGLDCVDVWQAMALAQLPYDQIEGFKLEN
jgi:hypothetical protein